MTTKNPDNYPKLQELLRIIKKFDKVAVAFSGGVDSSYLLHVVSSCLGPERVMALHASSCLIPSRAVQVGQELLSGFFAGRCQQHTAHFAPLFWPDFVQNPENRCYLCKKRLYTQLLSEAARCGYSFLVDGTNADDLQQHRPGMQALIELGIATPLLEAGLGKAEIRSLAREAGLPNHDLPSQSCLATRIPTGTAITETNLDRIDRAEEFLGGIGFTSCRVKFYDAFALIEIAETDFDKILTAPCRDRIVAYFASEQKVNVHLSLRSRR